MATWTDEQVKALNELQTGERYGHPYTCPNRGDGKHRHNGNDKGCLVATPDGWVCPDCDYTQDWAHESSMELPRTDDLFGLGHNERCSGAPKASPGT